MNHSSIPLMLFFIGIACMERKDSFIVGEIYHIYNRGVDKRNIFQDRNDRDRFRDRLYVYNTERAVNFRDVPEAFAFERGETTVDILAYTLMPNHFHLLIHEKKEGGISSFLGKLLTSYAMYFNTKYQRSGPLMCRPFRSSHVGDDTYLRWVFAYIHLNPLELIEPSFKERGIQNAKRAYMHLKSHAHSSYYDYFCADRKESSILSRDALPVELSDFAKGDELFSILQEASVQDAFTATDKFLA